MTGEVSRLARNTLQLLEIDRERIERDFISSRTKEELAKRKAEGMKLGLPVGGAKNLKLDKQADKPVSQRSTIRHVTVFCCVA